MAQLRAVEESFIVDEAFLDHYRCPAQYAAYTLTGALSKDRGFFRFGPQLVCYGHSSAGFRSARPTDSLHDVSPDVFTDDTSLGLPFVPTEVVDDLRSERYRPGIDGQLGSALAKAYYLVRPFLGVRVRKHLQRARFAGWQRLTFPNWPVDTTVEQIFERLLLLSLEAHSVERIPFIWFWPDGFENCVVMTHDIETAAGREFVPRLMDIDDEFGVKASFQVVPEGRYEVPSDFLAAMRTRGFEINVHDLNHDGHLFSDRETFRERVVAINRYGRLYGAQGFRSAVLYRNLDWLSALKFSYDMSVPSVGHLEAQRGGCCTSMPFFNGHLVELPMTTTQDYSLFHILRQHSIDLWQRQITGITAKHGLVSFIVHPDYVMEARPRATYRALLNHLKDLRREAKSWMTLPGEVSKWWRDRSRMKLSPHGNGWKVEGPGSERARVGYASRGENGIMYRLHGAFWMFESEELIVGLLLLLVYSLVTVFYTTLLPRSSDVRQTPAVA